MKNDKGYLIIFLVFVILLSSSSCNSLGQKTEPTAVLTPTSTTQPTNVKHEFSVDGVERTYWLRIPLDLNDTQPAPVVFVFHGIGGAPQNMFKTGFNTIADQEELILVYPALQWPFKPDFIRQILSDLGTKISIDPKRIYATGFSYGGELAYRLACEMSDTFAAIAAVSGMGHCISSQPEHAVSVIHIHGLGDDLVTYDGVGGSFIFLPVDEVIAFWVQFNDCAISAQEEKNDRIAHTTYTPCRDGTAVELYTIEAMGHKWPAREMPASQIIWEFFEAHPKP